MPVIRSLAGIRVCGIRTINGGDGARRLRFTYNCFMLTRFSCDNYRCLVKFTFQPASLQLLMGRNGAGKTSIFDALAAIRDLLVEGEKCEDLFPLASIPRWLKGEKPQLFQQRFEVELDGEHGVILYVLVVEQDEKLVRSRVFSEQLTADGKPLFESYEGRVQLYRDDHTKGPQYTADWSRSALGSVLAGPDDRYLVWFKERIRAVECVRIDAPRMTARSEREEARPDAICRTSHRGIDVPSSPTRPRCRRTCRASARSSGVFRASICTIWVRVS